MPRCVVYVTACVVCTTFLAACEAEHPPAGTQSVSPQAQSHDTRVDIHGDSVTVHAKDARLRDVVEQIAHRSGIVLVLQDPLDERVSLDLERLPLTEALRRILRDRGFVFQQAGESSQAGRRGAARAGRLWIFPRESGPTWPAATSGDDVEESDVLDAGEAIAALSGGLAGDDANARLDAVSTLAEVGGDRATAALVVAALHDADSSVREEATYALGGIGSDDVDDVLRRALTDSNADVRKAAVGALEEMGTDRSAQSLADALNDTDVSIRAAAVDAIGEIGGDTAIQLLRRASIDSQSMVREAAAERLAELHTRT